jgi:hypothetical protein
MKLYVHPIALAQLQGTAVGSIATRPRNLLTLIEDTVEAHPESMPENGQGFFMLAEPARTMITAGVALRSKNPEDYVARVHREEIGLYLRRDSVPRADLIPDGVAAIVYTAEAFTADTQTSDEEKAAFEAEGFTHCLVTILAFKGPKPPVGPDRFVINLSGGNVRYGTMTADEIRAEAAEVAKYAETWCVVG